MHHHAQDISIAWLVHRPPTSMHWNRIYHLPTHTSPSSCFSYLRGEETPISRPENQGLSLTLLFPSLTLRHKYCWFLCMDCSCLHPLLSCPSYWLAPDPGFNLSFHIIATVTDWTGQIGSVPSQSVQSIHHTAFRILFLIILLAKVFQWLPTSCRAKLKIHTKQDHSGPALPSASFPFSTSSLKSQSVLLHKFTSLTLCVWKNLQQPLS